MYLPVCSTKFLLIDRQTIPLSRRHTVVKYIETGTASWEPEKPSEQCYRSFSLFHSSWWNYWSKLSVSLPISMFCPTAFSVQDLDAGRKAIPKPNLSREPPYTGKSIINPFLLIRGLSCPSSVQTSLSQNCLNLTINLLPVSWGDIVFFFYKSGLKLAFMPWGPCCPLKTILLNDLVGCDSTLQMVMAVFLIWSAPNSHYL